MTIAYYRYVVVVRLDAEGLAALAEPAGEVDGIAQLIELTVCTQWPGHPRVEAVRVDALEPLVTKTPPKKEKKNDDR